MADTSDARALAVALGALADADLATLLATRNVAPTASWTDFFDAAEALQDSASVVRALTLLPRAEAEALSEASRQGVAVAEQHRAALAALALIDADGLPLAATVAAVEATSFSQPASLDTPTEVEDDATVAERAFTSVTSVGDILQSTLVHPLARIGTGALAAGDRRRLIDAGAADVNTVDHLVDLAVKVGLLGSVDRTWLVTERGREWLTRTTVQRWCMVAHDLITTLPSGLRAADGSLIDSTSWSDAYPFDSAWSGTSQRLAAHLFLWGVLDNSGRHVPWAQGLLAGKDADVELLQEHLPHEVDRVFLQNDLTAIAPGPLLPHIELRLRTMARRESRAQASTYRFTAETIGTALTAGETAETLREFLSGLSLTGVPQPLLYEIDRAAARYGLLRVDTDNRGHARVRSVDAALLDTLAVDQALRPLGLTRDADSLISRSGADAVFWMLADARYPVVAVDAQDQVRRTSRERMAPADLQALTPSEKYKTLIAQLRQVVAGDSDAAWLIREIEQAVRTRALVIVAVRLPDGQIREFTVEAAGLSGGRLRGRDKAADVERTLPVTSIASIRPA